MMIQVLACEFVHRLREQIGMDKLAEMVGRNQADPDPNICHSHDFCDANMVMFEAFVAVLGREPGFVSAKDEALSDADLELADKAWNLARLLLGEQTFVLQKE